MDDERILFFEPDVHRKLVLYARHLFAPEDDALIQAQRNSDAAGLPVIQIRPEEGQMLQFLVAAVGATRVLEIGTLAGYSGIWMARALPADGHLITLEMDPKHAAVARRNFELAQVADRVEVIEGKAIDSLHKLDHSAPFDLVFIDADKESNMAYLEWAIGHVRSGGLIAAHNAFREGALLENNPKANVTRQYLERTAQDERLRSSTIIPVGDGIAVAVVR